VAIWLNSTNISVTRKKFLVSFDVEAFYIPVDDAIREVSRTWKDEIQPSLTEKAMFKMGIELACKNLVCQFNGAFYLQAKGIAMGVACSPDIANMYGAMFEEEFMSQSSSVNKNVAFYGRFIDDGFMILYADDAETALSDAKRIVQFGDLNLTWEVSEYSLSFLDMTIYIDQVTGKIEHRPFRKARSHLERIPFVSHHPLDVRKGTFLGEMSRMAVLSSNPDNYVHALEDLQSIYIAHGYPPGLISKWTKDNITKRWINRLRETNSDDRMVVNRSGVVSSDLLILKTVFNPIWEKFNIHELAEVVVNHWLSSLNNWGWYDKQLFKYVKETYPEISGNVSWGMAKKIAKQDGFFPSKESEDSAEDLSKEFLDDLR
jgi:hypothetical protein